MRLAFESRQLRTPALPESELVRRLKEKPRRSGASLLERDLGERIPRSISATTLTAYKFRKYP
jgi:hypothetical protein